VCIPANLGSFHILYYTTTATQEKTTRAHTGTKTNNMHDVANIIRSKDNP